MLGLFCFALAALGAPLKSKLRLEKENSVLRHQLIVLRQRTVASIDESRKIPASWACLTLRSTDQLAAGT